MSAEDQPQHGRNVEVREQFNGIMTMFGRSAWCFACSPHLQSHRFSSSLYFRSVVAQFDADMTRIGMGLFAIGLLVFLAGRLELSAAADEAPDFREVYRLIQAHATGVSAAELNRAAVQGLITELGPKVSLVSPGLSENSDGAMPLVSKSRIFEGHVAYVRIGRVGDGLAEAVGNAYRNLGSTNALVGLVLDLRYADGKDYAASAATAGLFTSKSEPLLNWGAGVVSSHENAVAIRVPVAVLVNRGTARAAEALAAVVRETGAGLILGSATAGRAMITEDYPLADGEHLRIGVAPVALGDGSFLPATGVKPDIAVAVSPGLERAYFADAFATLEKTNAPAGTRVAAAGAVGATNLPARSTRLNEAELVREHEEGLDRDDDDEAPAAARPEPAKPLVNDPVLARALDLLKGLELVRKGHF